MDASATEVPANDRHRRSIRLEGHDYAHGGAYFVTLCTDQKRCVLGRIVNGEVVLSRIGEIVRDEWLRTAAIRENVELDEYVIMPNHIHAILMIKDVGATRWVALRTKPGRPTGPGAGSLGEVIGQFKSITTKRVNASRRTPGTLWQRNYYEHIIRNDQEFGCISQYIYDNPQRWAWDRNNPRCISVEEKDPWEL